MDSGIPYVILQPAVLMRIFAPAMQSVKQGGSFVQKFFISPQIKMSFVDVQDYAEAAASVVASPAFTYGTYEL